MFAQAATWGGTCVTGVGPACVALHPEPEPLTPILYQELKFEIDKLRKAKKEMENLFAGVDVAALKVPPWLPRS